MTLTSKKFRARFDINIRSNKVGKTSAHEIADSICSAVEPETGSLHSGQKISIICKGTYIHVDVQTPDLQSIRAIFNSYMFYIITGYGCVNAASLEFS